MKKEINQTLQVIKQDIEHVRADVDLLKSIMIGDTFLTKDEKKHIERTIKSFKKGQMSEFVSLEKV